MNLFFHGHLIISYVIDSVNNKYIFQLAGGDEQVVSKEDFVRHWQEYCHYEEERASQHTEGHYRPLPITCVIRRALQVFPANPSLRRKRKSA